MVRGDARICCGRLHCSETSSSMPKVTAVICSRDSTNQGGALGGQGVSKEGWKHGRQRREGLRKQRREATWMPLRGGVAEGSSTGGSGAGGVAEVEGDAGGAAELDGRDRAASADAGGTEAPQFKRRYLRLHGESATTPVHIKKPQAIELRHSVVRQDESNTNRTEAHVDPLKPWLDEYQQYLNAREVAPEVMDPQFSVTTALTKLNLIWS
ncbi:hypothetical protein B0H14DRAFT_2650227 [Mycena olivaceomarginata]|nr:hypothetical protein B0H14DRAFT_2650227 [Mycena olivaceomarginata]